MIKLRAAIFVLVLWASLALVRAQSQGEVEVNLSSLGTQLLQVNSGIVVASNNVVGVVTYTAPNGKTSNAVVTADRVSYNTNSGDVFAEGSVRIQIGQETIAGQTLHLNVYSREMSWNEFRAGEMPYFALGTSMSTVGTNAAIVGGWGKDIYRLFNPSVDNIGTNRAYIVTNAAVTTDDYSDPSQVISASEIKIVPGKFIEARNAVLYLDGVPVAYFPYLHRDLTHSPNHFSFLPGYRGAFGAYLLSSYDWTLNSNLSGAFHADVRTRRGFGTGPDFDYNLGKWGEGSIKCLFHPRRRSRPGPEPEHAAADDAPAGALFITRPRSLTNITLMSQVAYQTDPFIVRDFFESEYERDIEPNTFFDGDKLWNNWSLDMLASNRG